MAKLTPQKKKAYLEKQLSDINQNIVALRQQNLEPPDMLLKRLNKVKNELNPNKFNAKQTSYNGITFDSEIEADFCKFLDKMNISYELKKVFVLIEGFQLKYESGLASCSETVRPMTYEADFVIDDKIIIDVKGQKSTQTEQFNIKFKLLKDIYREKYIYLKVEDRKAFSLILPILYAARQVR